MRLLCTGGCGFIGSHVCEMLIDRPEVELLVCLDSLTYAGDLLNVASVLSHPKFRFEEVDVCDADGVNRVFQRHWITHVLHLAAESHVDRSIDGPQAFVTTNVAGTGVMLEAARQAWRAATYVHRFHVVSTDEVYGSIEVGSWDEDCKFAPNSPYAASKAAADLLAMSYFKTYGMPVTISHSSNNFGPRQHPEKLIPKAILNTLSGKPIPVYGDGKNERDWIHVSDHVDALWLVLTRGRNGERYNIGHGESLSNVNILNQIIALIERGKMEFVSDRLGHDFRYCVNPSKMMSEFGWVTSDTMRAALAATVGWYCRNTSWVDAVLSKS